MSLRLSGGPGARDGPAMVWLRWLASAAGSGRETRHPASPRSVIRQPARGELFAPVTRTPPARRLGVLGPPGPVSRARCASTRAVEQRDCPPCGGDGGSISRARSGAAKQKLPHPPENIRKARGSQTRRPEKSFPDPAIRSRKSARRNGSAQGGSGLGSRGKETTMLVVHGRKTREFSAADLSRIRT
jgi:hypothetical protein